MLKKGAILAIAWPDTKVRKVGMWYDKPLEIMGFSNNDYYVVGHAATVLIDYSTGNAHYFDFGRYHTPEKHGRVRDQHTDPELTISTKADIQKSKIINLQDILLELHNNHHTHGDGRMRVSVLEQINFNTAYKKAKQLQQKELIHYGPLDPRGTNCSRFVATVGRISTTSMLKKFIFRFPYTISPSPMSNVRLLNSYHFHFEVKNNEISIIYNWIKKTASNNKLKWVS